MKDLNINIGGPRDQARQQVSFKISQAGDRALDVEHINQLVAQLREALAESPLPPDDLRRAQRQLNTIEEEARSQRPMLSEMNEAVSFLDKLVQTAQGLSPLVINTFSLLAAAIGIPLGG